MRFGARARAHMCVCVYGTVACACVCGWHVGTRTSLFSFNLGSYLSCLSNLVSGRVKGFAFAAFTCRAHALKAVTALNGTVRARRAHTHTPCHAHITGCPERWRR